MKEVFSEGLFIFLVLLSLLEFKSCIVNCGIEIEDLINNCMCVVKEEIEFMDVYDYVVENDKVENVCVCICVIVMVEYCCCDCIFVCYKRMLEVE